MTYAVKVMGGSWHITEHIPDDVDCLEKVVDLNAVWEVPLGKCDPELDLIELFTPTVRCPVCYTHGHTHRKTCPHKDSGMSAHVKFKPKEPK